MSESAVLIFRSKTPYHLDKEKTYEAVLTSFEIFIHRSERFLVNENFQEKVSFFPTQCEIHQLTHDELELAFFIPAWENLIDHFHEDYIQKIQISFSENGVPLDLQWEFNHRYYDESEYRDDLEIDANEYLLTLVSTSKK